MKARACQGVLRNKLRLWKIWAFTPGPFELSGHPPKAANSGGLYSAPTWFAFEPTRFVLGFVAPRPAPCRPVRTLDIQACANRDQQSGTRHRPASCESRNWGSETARSCEGNEIPAFDAPPLDQAGAQHSQSPITAEGGAVMKYPTPANMAGSRRKSVIWDTISIGSTACCRVRSSARSNCSIDATPALVMTSDLGGFFSRNMRRSVRVMPRRRLEKVVNKVADDTSNLRLKALPVGLGGFHHSTLGRV